MANAQMDKYTAGFGISLIVTSLLNAVILLIKETNGDVMKAMKGALGHHWTTHGAIVVIVFVLLGLILSNMKMETKWDSGKMLTYIVWAVVIGGAIIAGFFLPGLKIAESIKY
jgi:hypothetical protein